MSNKTLCSDNDGRKGHPVCKNLCTTIPKGQVEEHDGGQLANSDSPFVLHKDGITYL